MSWYLLTQVPNYFWATREFLLRYEWTLILPLCVVEKPPLSLRTMCQLNMVLPQTCTCSIFSSSLVTECKLSKIQCLDPDIMYKWTATATAATAITVTKDASLRQLHLFRVHQPLSKISLLWPYPLTLRLSHRETKKSQKVLQQDIQTYFKVSLHQSHVQWCMAIMWGFVDSGAAIFPHSKPHIMEVAMNWADLCLGDFVWKEKGGWNRFFQCDNNAFLVWQNNRNANGLCLVAMCCPGIIKNYDNKFKQLLYLLVVPSQHLSCHLFVLEFHLKLLSLNMDSQHDHIHQGSLKKHINLAWNPASWGPSCSSNKKVRDACHDAKTQNILQVFWFFDQNGRSMVN